MAKCPQCSREVPVFEFHACPNCGRSISNRSSNSIAMKAIEGRHKMTTTFPPIPTTYWRPSSTEIRWSKGRHTNEGAWRVARETAGVITRGPGVSLDIGLYDVEFQIVPTERPLGSNPLLATVEATAFNNKVSLDSAPIYARDIPGQFDAEDERPVIGLSFFLDRFVEDVSFTITSKGKGQFDIYGIKLIPRLGDVWTATQLRKWGTEEKDWKASGKDGSVTFLAPSENQILYGSYEYVSPGSYQVLYRLSLPEKEVSGIVAELDVISASVEGGESETKHNIIVNSQPVEAEHLKKSRGIGDYKVHFHTELPLNKVEFRVKPLVEGLRVHCVRLVTDQEAIWQHYYQLGGLHSALGAPRGGYQAAETSPWLTEGSLIRFEGGSIYWVDSLGCTFDVTGPIGEYWESKSGTGGFLGFPLTRPTNVTSPFGTKGLSQEFENGSIYDYIDRFGSKKVHQVYGAINWRYIKEGAAGGKFGFPVLDGEEDWNREGVAFRRSIFEGGAITWEKEGHHAEAHIFPIPEVSVVVKAEDPQPNQPIRIQVFARNHGGESKEGYFSVSFPDPVDIVSFRRTSRNINHIQDLLEGQVWNGGYGMGGRTYPFKYPMIEAVLTPATTDELYSFEVIVKPLVSGVFRIESKCSMRKPLDLGWIADPAIGSDKLLGQQKEHVYITEVKIEGQRTPRSVGGIQLNQAVRDVIFIAYRRTDSGEYAERIYERLEEEFGSDRVFLDTKSIPLGTDYSDAIGGALKRCAVQLVLIGERWLDSWNRLQDSSDLHRMEIDEALNSQIPVIPVVLDSAAFLEKKVLPPRLKPLADRQGIPIRTKSGFGEDMEALIVEIEQYMPSS